MLYTTPVCFIILLGKAFNISLLKVFNKYMYFQQVLPFHWKFHSILQRMDLYAPKCTWTLLINRLKTLILDPLVKSTTDMLM